MKNPKKSNLFNTKNFFHLIHAITFHFYDGNSLKLFKLTHILIHNWWKTISTKKFISMMYQKWKLKTKMCNDLFLCTADTHSNVENFHQHKLSNRKIKTVFFSSIEMQLKICLRKSSSVEWELRPENIFRNEDEKDDEK